MVKINLLLYIVFTALLLFGAVGLRKALHQPPCSCEMQKNHECPPHGP